MESPEATVRSVSDSELLVAHCNGDGKAFGILVERHGTMVYRICRRFIPEQSHSSVEDAVQTVFVVLARKSSELVQYVSLVGWLHRTAWYVTRNQRRGEGGPLSYSVPLDTVEQIDHAASSAADEVNSRETYAALHEAIETLPEGQRVAIVEHYLAGKTYEQIAVEQGCSKASIQTHIARGRDRLKKALDRRGVALSAAMLLAGLEAEAAEDATSQEASLVRHWSVEQCDEHARKVAADVMAEMDRVASKAMWERIGCTVAGLATIVVGTALVVSQLHTVPAPASTTVSWRFESVSGSAMVRRNQAMQVLKTGDGLYAGDTILTSSNQEVAVVSDAGDRILVREDSELRLETVHDDTNSAGSGDPAYKNVGRVTSRGGIPILTAMFLTKGAIVSQIKHPQELATPHAGIQTSNADFLLMVASGLTTNGALWSFTRLDVTGGSARFRPSSISDLKSEIPLVSRQAVSAGTDHEGKVIATVARKSDGRELSPKYEGVFFLDCAKSYASRRYVWDTMPRVERGQEIVLSAADLMRTVQCNFDVEKTLVSVHGRDAVSLRPSSSTTEVVAVFPFPVDGSRVSAYESDVYSDAQTQIGFEICGWVDLVPSFAPSIIGYEKRSASAGAGGWISIHDAFLHVGRTAEGHLLMEIRARINGNLAKSCWGTGNATGRLIRFKGKELLVARMKVCMAE